jgi:dephospho-CoA kinase
MEQKKPIIGLAGGIGAGKSTVAAEFGRQGCLVIDSDRLNRDVLRRPEVVSRLQEWWGSDVVEEGGEPNYGRIAEIVFADPGSRRRLEELTHPLIAQVRQAMICAVEEDQAVKAVILDSPLLIERNLDRLCHAIIFVEASEAQRLRRLRASRKWTEQQVRGREKWQAALEAKRARSDFIIDNDGSPDRLRPQVKVILEEIISRFKGGR